MAREKIGARKSAAINPDNESRLNGGDEHNLALAGISPVEPGPGFVTSAVSISAGSTVFSENFNTLAATGTGSAVPAGWAFAESPGNSSFSPGAAYSTGSGTSTTGDTYSFGTGTGTDRAFGQLRSGSSATIIGASFTNNTGATIGSLLISYVGEQWRFGAVHTTIGDKMDFQISFNATSLTTGNWTDVNALDFAALVTTGSGRALDGNASGNFINISSTIADLHLANGATFWIRWTDVDASSSDDGLAIDDFSLTATTLPAEPVVDLNGATTGTGFTSTYTETPGGGGDGARIGAATMTITDDLDTIDHVTLTITNGRFGDRIYIDGSDGFSLSVQVDEGPNHVWTLTTYNGAVYTPAQWADAVAHLRFFNTGRNPDGDGNRPVVTINVVASDGTHDSAAATASITVVPFNDPAEISETTNSAVREDDYQAPSFTSGGMFIFDPDGPDTVVPINNQLYTYGRFTMDAAGNWTYTLDPALTNHLQTGDTEIDVITITSADGTTYNMQMTVEGHSDGAAIDHLEGDIVTWSGTGAVLLDAGAALTVTDTDSANFDFTTLYMTTSGNSSEDILFVQGTAGVVEVDAGNNVLVGGVVIGTVAGIGTNDVSFSFNSEATFARVEAMMRALAYDNRNTDPDSPPDPSARSVTYSFAGLGGEITYHSTVNMGLINEAPVADLNGVNESGNDYAATYVTGDSAGVAIGDSDLAILDNGTVGPIKLVITDGVAGDVLFADAGLPADFIPVWDANTFTLTLSFYYPTNTTTAFADALTHIRYRHDGADPTAGGTDTQRTIAVTPSDFTQDGPASFTTVTINDAPSPGTLSIDDVTHTEGTGGTTEFLFTVTRSGGADGAVSATWTLDFAGAPTGAEGVDFANGQAFTGTVNFADGATTATISILVEGDTFVEQDETFSMTLSDPTGGASLGDAGGLGTILNDDSPPPNQPPVVFNGVGDFHSDEDAPVSYTFAADAFSDPDGDGMTYRAVLADGQDSPLPGWLSFDAGTRTFSGTPPQDYNGTLSIIVTAADRSGGSASDTFDLVIDPVDDAAQFSGDDTGSVFEDGTATASGTLVASDPDSLPGFQGADLLGTFGSFVMGTDGHWTYNLNNSAANVQALMGGDQAFDLFTVHSTDGTAHTIAIAVNGADETPPPPPPPPTVDLDSGTGGIDYVTSYTENDVIAIGSGITLTSDSGTINSATIELTNGAAGDAIVLGGAIPPGFNVSGDDTHIVITGQGTLADYQALLSAIRFFNGSDDPAETDRTVTVTVNDGAGGDSAAATTTIHVLAVNDAPGSSPVHFVMPPDGVHTLNAGDLNLGDVDGDNITGITITGQAPGTLALYDPDGVGGVAPVSAVGLFIPIANLGDVTIQYAADYAGFGPNYGISYTVSDDGGTANGGADTSGTYSLTFSQPTVYVDLDGATLSYNYNGVYNENDAGAAISNAAHINAQGPNLFFLIVEITDGQFGDQLTYNAAFASGLSVQASPTQLVFTGIRSVGQYESLLASIRYLNTTEDPAAFGNTNRVISVQVSDPAAAQNSALSYATITVNSINDIANISGTHTGSVPEEGGTVQGQLIVSDLDPNQAQVNAYFTRGNYGAFSIDATGFWSYGGDYNNQLRAGQTLTDTFTVTSLDGSASIDVVITIVGANDVPELFLPEDGDIGAAAEDDPFQSFAQGFVGLNDPDDGEDSWQVGTFVTAYGTFTVDTDTGAWEYVLNNASAATQGLHGGQTVVDQVTFTSFDGTLTHDVKVTITGASDAATIGGTITGDVSEDSQLTTTGTLSISDADSGENEVQAISAGTAGANNYGTFQVLADGHWTYSLNNGLAAVQNLNTGQTLTDTILVTSKDGSDTETITVTIHGRTEGVNAPPTVANPIQDQFGTEDVAVNYQLPANTFFDADGDTLQYSATNLAGEPLPDWLHFDANTRTFTGTPPQDYAGGVAVRVTASDGQASASDDFVFYFNPTPDFPTGASHTVTTNEDVTYTFTFADFGYADPDADAPAGVYIHTNASSAGIVFLNGVGLTGTSNFVSLADIDAGLLTFRAPLNAFGDDFATFGFQVLDVTGNATGLDQTIRTMTIDVTAVDDPVVIVVPASDVTFTEDGPAVTLDPNLTVTDVDGPASINHAAVVISGGFVASEDLLTWDTAFAAAHGITAVLSDETLTFDGTASLADYQTLLRSVAYLNTNHGNPNTGDREITFGAGSPGGVSNALGAGAITDLAQPGVDHTVIVHVAGTTDFPTGTSATVTMNEDVPYVFSFGDFGYADPDGDAMAGVYIHTNGSSDGLIYLNGVALHGASNFVSRADLDNGLLTFVPPLNANGDDFATFGFQVLDTTGNTTGLDQTTRTMTIDVNPVNDAPDASPVPFTLAATATHVLSLADFGFSDVEGNNIEGIYIDSVLPGTIVTVDLGTGSPVDAVGRFIPIGQISSLAVSYNQATYSGFGPSYGFVFTVTDDGGTANGGRDVSGFEYLTFGLNQAPVFGGGALTGSVTELPDGDPNEGIQADTASGSIAFTDADTGDTHIASFTPGGGGYIGTFATSVTETVGSGAGSVGWSWTAPDAVLDSLRAGQVINQTYTITVDDGNGGTDTEVVTITLAGANDAPILNPIPSGVVTDTAADDTYANLTGTFTVIDPDIGDTKSFSIVGGVATAEPGFTWEKSSTYGTLYVDAVTGAYKFVVNDGAVEGLVNDDQASFGITVTDGSAATDTKIYTINIDGFNDNPVLGAVGPVSYVDTSADDSFTDVTGTLSATDRDSGDSSTFSISGGAVSGDPSFTYQKTGTYGTLFVNTISGAWKFVANDAAIEALKTSQSETFQLVATDTHGGIGLQTLTINVTGANDTPVLAAVVSAVYFDTVNDDVFANHDGTLVSSDRDNPETATYALAGGVSSGLAGFDQQITSAHGTVYVNATTGAYRFVPNDAAIEALKTTVTDSVTFTVTDGSGAISSQQFDIVLNGVNDRPDLTVIAGDSAGASLAETNAGLTAGGSLTPVDRDMDPVFLSLNAFAKSGTTAGLGLSDLQLQAMFGVLPGGLFAPGANAAAWSFNSGGAAFNYLAQGENLVLTYTLSVNDGTLQSNTQDVVITINGTNDAPVLDAIPTIDYFDTPGDDTFSTVNGTLAASDADVSDTLTYSISGQVADTTVSGFDHSLGTAYGRLYLNSATGAYRFVPDDPGIEALKTATSVDFTLNVVDNHGVSDSKLLTVNLLGVNDAPAGADKTLTGSEDDPVVFAATDFGFSDTAEGDNLLAVKITTLPVAGTLYLDSDGAGANPAVAVTAGQTISLADINAGHLYFLGAADGFGSPYASFTFQVQDNGGTANGGIDLDQSANTITITLTPDNLPPVVDLNGGAAGIDYAGTYTEDAAPAGIGLGIIVSDPDSGIGDLIESATVTLTDRAAGDSLTFSTPLPGGFSQTTTSAAGSITIVITGPGTGAQYQAILNSIVYATTNDEPTFGGTDPSRTITVTVNDGLADSATATATINVVTVDDAPVARPDAFTITESGTITGGNLFADNGSGADSDPDGPALSISAVNGSAANVNTQISLASGAHLTVNANGTFNYDPNGAFLSTPTPGSGASNTPGHDSFTYTLAGGNTVTVTITLTGLDTNDALFGTAGVDVMFAGAGNDYLEGLAGSDQLHGGTGNDVYVVETTGDQVFEAAGEGNDLVYTSTDYALGGGQEVETLAARDNSLTVALAMIGNEFANTLLGNNGANFLDGGAAADLMAGYGGNDIYAVDNAGDQVFEGAGGGSDTVYTTVSYALGGGQSVETLAARDNSATTALNLVGNELANTLLGNNGANFLDGGDASDILVGYGGNDVYAVDNAADQVFEGAGGGTDTIYTTASYTLAAGQSVETLAARDNSLTVALNLTGNELANTLLGNNGVNILDGGAGADVMAGYGGNDLFAFTTALGGGNVDFITDFTHGADKIGLDDAIFTHVGGLGPLSAGAFATGTAAGDADDRIIYNNATGALLYDADGVGGAAAVQFATLQPGLTITSTDFIVI